MAYAQAVREITYLLNREVDWEIIEGQPPFTVGDAVAVTRYSATLFTVASWNDAFVPGCVLILSNADDPSEYEVTRIVSTDRSARTVTLSRNIRGLGQLTMSKSKSYELIVAYCPVTSATSSDTAAEDQNQDFVVVSRLPSKMDDIWTMDGPSGLSIQDIQVSPFSLRREQVTFMTDKIKVALDNYSGKPRDESGAPTIQATIFKEAFDVFEEESSQFGLALSYCVAIVDPPTL